tara:strand:- start:235 stop:414 length:180 start_codon:yes stop_codon:yes gene_type:complete
MNVFLVGSDMALKIMEFSLKQLEEKIEILKKTSNSIKSDMSNFENVNSGIKSTPNTYLF